MEELIVHILNLKLSQSHGHQEDILNRDRARHSGHNPPVRTQSHVDNCDIQTYPSRIRLYLIYSERSNLTLYDA